jgi:hypothetical protein
MPIDSLMRPGHISMIAAAAAFALIAQTSIAHESDIARPAGPPHSIGQHTAPYPLTVEIPISQQRAPAPEVTLRLSSDTIRLGEPVWVLVTARNTSAVAMRWNPGDYCGLRVPVSAVVPAATQGSARPVACQYGAPPLSCQTGASTTVLASGASATWRYLVEGDFHFTRAGTYQVVLTSHPGIAFSRDTTAAIPVTQTRALVVLPSNDALLLARQQQLASAIETAMLRADYTGSTSAGRDSSYRAYLNIRQLRHGVAVHPAPGMELVFERWLQLNDFEDDAILGLKNLNSAGARATLMTLASTPSRPNRYTQSGATNALAEMGAPVPLQESRDREIFLLMVKHLSSPHELLRQAAVRGVANLGGEQGVAMLLQIARSETGTMSRTAITRLGSTASRTAVKGLIDLMAPQAGRAPVGAEWPLFLLTHHQLPSIGRLRTPVETHQEWQRWWDTTGQDAPVYAPYQCAPR